MDTFSYRHLLEMTRLLAAAGAGFGLLLTLVRFLAPLMARKRLVSVGAGTSGSQAAALSLARSPLLDRASWGIVAAALASFLASASAMAARYLEVRHWPAQSMFEVIPLGVTAGFLSSLVLYFVLGLQRKHGLSRAFGDMFLALLLLGGAFTLQFVLGLDPTGRPLPPALQSYWFPTHITAYMFGYFTFFIATLATWLHFCFKFWRGILQKSRYPVPPRTLVAIGLFTLAPVPFGSQGVLFGPGVMLLTGLVTLVSQAIPGKMAWFDTWEEGSDHFTWLIFVVGFPFLTAGLIQGSLWAQEAWATYWGWDSKEVSALISWFFYAIYLHLRYVAGWRGEKGMWILLFGGLSVFITFQLFGFLPASQSSLHRYTDMTVVPAEGMMDPGAN